MDRKLADRIVKGNFVEENEENQCFVKCLYQTFGIIDEDGDFLPEVARRKVPKPLGHFKEMVSCSLLHFLYLKYEKVLYCA